MNQNLPPNEPGPDEQAPGGRDAPSFARNAGQAEYENPYYGGRRTDADPDLDADAPVLRSSDVQRLNRKALVFLAGIIGLLALMTFWLLSRAGSDAEEARPERTQAVVVPDLPQSGTELPPIETVPDAQTVAVPPLPMAPEGDATGYAASNEPPGPRPPSLVERRISGIAGSASGGSSNAGAMPGHGGTTTAVGTTEATSAQFVSNPDSLLVRGTYLRCVLETRIVTDVPGFTSCIVTEPIYSINGRTLLLPKGSKILGRYDEEPKTARVAVVWDRIITPGGIDVSMRSPGVDGLGGAGHPGDLSNHWGSKIASALLISLISDAFSWAAAEYGPETEATFLGGGGVTVVEQPFESATARSMERLANQALMKSANRAPTVTINHGTVVSVYVAQDVDFSGVLALR